MKKLSVIVVALFASCFAMASFAASRTIQVTLSGCELLSTPLTFPATETDSSIIENGSMNHAILSKRLETYYEIDNLKIDRSTQTGTFSYIYDPATTPGETVGGMNFTYKTIVDGGRTILKLSFPYCHQGNEVCNAFAGMQISY